MDNVEDILNLITPCNMNDQVLMTTIINYVHINLLSEAAKKYLAQKKQRRRTWMWPYLQRRVELGHYESLLEELSAENPELYRNFTRIDKDLFNEIVERVSPQIRKRFTNFREPLAHFPHVFYDRRLAQERPLDSRRTGLVATSYFHNFPRRRASGRGMIHRRRNLVPHR